MHKINTLEPKANANQTGINLIIFLFAIRGKLSMMR